MRQVLPLDSLAGTAPDRGLTSAEVEERRRVFGPNRIIERESAGWGDIVRDTSRDPMVWFLMGTAVLFAVLGDYVESAILVFAILPIVGMDAYLHRRTQASTEGLAGRLESVVLVSRDGEDRVVPAEDLVPGDLVRVTEGHAFPADGIIVAADGVQVDESALTGEAMPVRKRPCPPAALVGIETLLDDHSRGSAGTRVLTGVARLRVTATGADTLYGQIVRSAQAGRHERTPLQGAVDSLLGVLVVAALALCAALAAIRYAQGHGLADALLSAVTLAVAALPEEFPVVFAVFLSVGVYRLAKRQALVRRSVAVENIGRVTCICSDKTGTITEGRLALAGLFPAQGHSRERLLRLARIASRATSGDPMDIALHVNQADAVADRVGTFPFTEDRRRETGVVRSGDGYLVAVKGAPEAVLPLCSVDEAELAAVREVVERLGSAAYKVIACAALETTDWRGEEPGAGYRLAGLVAFEDPVREGVVDAIARAQAAGIRVIMVTGDHVATATAVARRVGIGKGAPKVLDGLEVMRALDVAGAPLPECDVVARAAPTQKLALVQALRAAGEIVAVTGDGVNDAPALQGADIGIAMGERGARTAREVAAIVLLDDNFRTVVRAVVEGRQLFRNLKLSFAYLLMAHVPLVLTAAIIPLFGYPLLYLPIHIVWLELILHPTALLVFQDLPAADTLDPVQRTSRVRFFTGDEWLLIGVVGLSATSMIIFGFVRSLQEDGSVEHARAMALVTLIIAGATVTAALSRLASRTSRIAFAAPIMSALVLLQTTQLSALLHLKPLHIDDWLLAGLSGALCGLPAWWLARAPRHVAARAS